MQNGEVDAHRFIRGRFGRRVAIFGSLSISGHDSKQQKKGKRLRGMDNLNLKKRKLPHLGHFSKEILDLVAP
jgi:hypothetical protein